MYLDSEKNGIKEIVKLLRSYKDSAQLLIADKLIQGGNTDISIKLNFDSIKLPSPYSSKDIWLISPKFEFTFSKKIFWTTYIQYSSQLEDLGINSRLQYRFAPLSDLYLVYNDNYFTTNSIQPRFRSINLKLTYWFNI